MDNYAEKDMYFMSHYSIVLSIELFVNGTGHNVLIVVFIFVKILVINGWMYIQKYMYISCRTRAFNRTFLWNSPSLFGQSGSVSP